MLDIWASSSSACLLSCPSPTQYAAAADSCLEAPLGYVPTPGATTPIACPPVLNSSPKSPLSATIAAPRRSAPRICAIVPLSRPTRWHDELRPLPYAGEVSRRGNGCVHGLLAGLLQRLRRVGLLALSAGHLQRRRSVDLHAVRERPLRGLPRLATVMPQRDQRTAEGEPWEPAKRPLAHCVQIDAAAAL